MHITLEIDEEAKALYFRLKDGEIAETIEYKDKEEIFLDFSEDGEVLAIEVLDPGGVELQSIFKELTQHYGIEDLSLLVNKPLVDLAA